VVGAVGEPQAEMINTTARTITFGPGRNLHQLFMLRADTQSPGTTSAEVAENPASEALHEYARQ
jgi:hypothetical protein